MQIWGWLQPWWNWWAGFTDLFDWDAIAALATLWAVLVALDQSSRASRVEAQHGAGVFTILIGLLEPLPELLPFEAGLSLSVGDARAVLDERMIETAEAGLAQLSVQDTSRLGISDYLGALPFALESIRQGLPAVIEGHSKGRDLKSHLDYIWEAVEDFRRRRSLLQHGRFGAAIREFKTSIGRYFRRS